MEYNSPMTIEQIQMAIMEIPVTMEELNKYSGAIERKDHVFNMAINAKIKEQNFTIRGYFIVAKGIIKSSDSLTVIKMNVRYICFIRFILGLVLLFLGVALVSENFQINGQAASFLERLGNVIMGLLLIGITAFLFNMAKETFTRRIITKLQLTPING